MQLIGQVAVRSEYKELIELIMMLKKVSSGFGTKMKVEVKLLGLGLPQWALNKVDWAHGWRLWTEGWV